MQRNQVFICWVNVDTAAKLQVCVHVSLSGRDGRGKWDRIRQDSPPRPNFLSCTDLVPTSQSGETLLALLRTHSWLPPRVSTISRIATAAPDSKFWDNSHLHSVLQLGDGGNSVRVINDLYSLNHYFISLNLVATLSSCSELILHCLPLPWPPFQLLL